MGLKSWIFGSGIKEAAEGIDTVATTTGNLLVRFRTAITGEMDPAKKAELEEMEKELEGVASKSQHALNIINAKSKSLFIAGWRPAIGWVCALALFTYYIPSYLIELSVWREQSFLLFEAAKEAKQLAGFTPPTAPKMAIGDIIGLVMSLLGMAGMRSYEKTKGKQDNH